MPDNSPKLEDQPDRTEHDAEFDAEFDEARRSRAAYPWMRVGAQALALAGFAVLTVSPMLPQPSLTV